MDGPELQVDMSNGDDWTVITAPTCDELCRRFSDVAEGTVAIVGNDKQYVFVNNSWIKQADEQEAPDWIVKWFEAGKNLEINEERTKEELDRLKECIVGISFIHGYCRDKELPSAVIDLIIVETATRWYEADHNVKVTDPYMCKELPAYHVFVSEFIKGFSEHCEHVRATATANMSSETDDTESPLFEVETPSNKE